jgi:hypothetical protein
MVTFDYWGYGTVSMNLAIYAIQGAIVIIAVLYVGILAGKKLQRESK